MADIVASSVVQEGVSRMSSYISGKLEEKASRRHMIARLEMALSQLEFALERTAKLPITYISLLRRWKILKQAYMEGTDLLKRHKLQLLTNEPQEQLNDHGVWRAVSSLPLLEQIFGGARNLSVSSLHGLSKEEYLSSSIVQIFERYADCADKFVTDVESGCPLRHDTFRYPLERQLLEGKTLMYQIVNGSVSRHIAMWPVCSEGRGIEVELFYSYEDRKMPAKTFFLLLRQRLSQGTSIVGTTIRCLQFVTESLNLLTCVTETAIGQITLLSSLQDFSHFYAPPPGCSEEMYVEQNRLCRPDPTCCGNYVVSPDLSKHGVPESVTGIYFSCSISADVVATNAPLLHLVFLFLAHVSFARTQEIVVEFEGRKELTRGSSMQLMEELLRSRAFDCLAHHPEPAEYVVGWSSTWCGTHVFGEVKA